MKKKFFIIAGSIFSLILLFICIEILLRVYSKITPAFFAPTDKTYNQFRPKPNSWVNGFQVNSKGFQDEEFSVPKKAGTFRILAIGDSFTLGVVPYENNFVTLLENSLREKKSYIEIFNMGISATTIRGYLSLFVDEGLDLNPDMILLNIYIGNDIFDSEKKVESSLYTLRFIKYIRAIFLYNELTSDWSKRIGSDSKDYSYDNNRKTMNETTFYQLQKDLFIIYFDNKYTLGSLKYKYASIFRDLHTFNEICKSKNIKLLVTLFPSEIQVDQSLQKIIETEFTNDPIVGAFGSYETFIKSINYSLPNRIIGEELKKQNIQYIDLLDSFKEKALTTKLYKPNDTHWNIEGNLLAAEVLEQYFLEKK